MQKNYCKSQKIIWTTRDVLRAARVRFPLAASVSRSIVAHVCQTSVEWTFMQDGAVLDRTCVSTIFSFLRRIHRGEPFSRVVGCKEFFSYNFLITPATLDPRPETEGVVQACLEVLPQGRPVTLMDLGAGSGCIALSIVLQRPQAEAILIENNQDALNVARQNAQVHDVTERCSFVLSCMAEYTGGVVDCICSNPPYIAKGDLSGLPENVIKYDPLCALDGGMQGLDYYRIILKRYPAMLKKDGFLIMELGINQAQPVCALADMFGWDIVRLLEDLQGIKRVLVLKKASCP